MQVKLRAGRISKAIFPVCRETEIYGGEKRSELGEEWGETGRWNRSGLLVLPDDPVPIFPGKVKSLSEQEDPLTDSSVGTALKI